VSAGTAADVIVLPKITTNVQWRNVALEHEPNIFSAAEAYNVRPKLLQYFYWQKL